MNPAMATAGGDISSWKAYVGLVSVDAGSLVTTVSVSFELWRVDPDDYTSMEKIGDFSSAFLTADYDCGLNSNPIESGAIIGNAAPTGLTIGGGDLLAVKFNSGTGSLNANRIEKLFLNLTIN